MDWVKRAADSIIPISQSKNFASALREWRYTGEMVDHGEPCETCELCGQIDLRYHFRIKNIHTNYTLWVGSECITRFKISYTDSAGVTYDEEASRQKVARDRRNLVKDAKVQQAIDSLIELSKKDKDMDILSFIDNFETLTPKQVVTLLWRMKKFGVPYSPALFGISIKTNRNKDQLANFEDWQYKLILPCLTKTQYSWLVKARPDKFKEK